jgi:CheY-like chemotaxis protein/HPt (histidine-containing phosphotransfer) domain-containing protein
MNNVQRDDSPRHAKMTDEQRDAVLARLAADEPDARSRNRRAAQRLSYVRNDIPVRLKHPGGNVAECTLASRDLSSTGISFLYWSFLHIGTECRIVLRKLDGSHLAANGKVAWCRHVMGPHHLIGVRFNARIATRAVVESGNELAGLNPGALAGRLLFVEPQELERALAAHHLRDTCLAIEEAENVDLALTRLAATHFDVILCDISLESPAKGPAIKAFRTAGFTGPIIALAADADDTRLTAAKEAGVNSILSKPYEPEQLLNEIAAALGIAVGASEEPIFSAALDRPGMAPLIVHYIRSVGDHVHRIAEARTANNVDAIKSCCKSLKGTGSAFGFPQVSRAARDAIDAIDAIDLAGSLTDCARQLDELISLCRRLAAHPAE